MKRGIKMAMTEKQIREYVDFMYNKDNIRNCECCPENRNFGDWQDRYPCANGAAGYISTVEVNRNGKENIQRCYCTI